MTWVVGLLLISAECGPPAAEVAKRFEAVPGLEHGLAVHGYVAGLSETRFGRRAVIC